MSPLHEQLERLECRSMHKSPHDTAARNLDMAQSRENLRKLHKTGYDIAVQSVLQGISRNVDVGNNEDWERFKDQVGSRQVVDYQEDVDALLSEPQVVSFCVSYRHVNPPVRKRRGDTVNKEQWKRLHNGLSRFANTYRSSQFLLWIDQILHCSKSMTSQIGWVSKGALSYAVMPVLYVGGPDESKEEDHQRRLWVAVERFAALTNSGIAMHRQSDDWRVLRGTSLSVAQALKWLGSRIIGGIFNSCGMS